jgi:hypothetical protein
MSQTPGDQDPTTSTNAAPDPDTEASLGGHASARGRIEAIPTGHGA